MDNFEGAKKPEAILAGGATVLSLVGLVYLYRETTSIKESMEIIESHLKQNIIEVSKTSGVDAQILQIKNRKCRRFN